MLCAFLMCFLQTSHASTSHMDADVHPWVNITQQPVPHAAAGPSSAAASGSTAAASSSSSSDELHFIAGLVSGSDGTVSELMARREALHDMNAWLRRGDVPHALQAARRRDIPVASASFLEAALTNPIFENQLEMDAVSELVPVLVGILGLEKERHVQAGLNVCDLLCCGIVPVIQDTIAAYNPHVLDLAGERRKQRADTAQLVLKGLLPQLGSVAQQRAGTPLAVQAQQVAEQISNM